ncbi:nucleoside triphosphate pyrophosphohydrolase [Thioalkalivibrio sulfidiphilus]|uniref:nucleoside triphosphate pyrophosphohydrolase n=1 Tax=Thioalkalivibrio sulfidiphilus TaxID=1033854 RepID=UPI00036F9E21|nr:nucleoside triphosphate pyrophosphohydrolase [Thioalkalivibrio sulfidiphilus]
MSSQDLPEDPLERVLAIMARLRDPEAGCPWDLRQTWETIVPHTLEEAYEVADAISRRDFEAVRGELGDLLLQVVFYARIAEEEGRFDIQDVARTLAEKLVRRHPHVFADVRYDTEAEHHAAWEAEKARERVEAGEGRGPLDGVALALPALTRAVKLQKRAARVGFDWDGPGPVLDKVLEEFEEIRAEIEAEAPEARLRDEVGDLLFSVANLARHLGVDPEAALRGTNARFEHRFRFMEQALAAQGRRLEDADLQELDGLWEQAKQK